MTGRVSRSPGSPAGEEVGGAGAVDAPELRVVKGEATAEELAALVAVVVARRAAISPDAPVVVHRSGSAASSGWTARERGLRGVHRHGPGRWWASTLPR